MITAEEIIENLNLQKHQEGGFFSETYRSTEVVTQSKWKNRPFSTAIYYMLTADTFSEMHRLTQDEIFHFYIGDPVEMLHLYPNGEGKKVILGTDINSNMSPQVIIPAGVWQGARLCPGGSCGYALMGTTVSPGFEYVDYLSGEREKLIRQYPQFKDLISLLTK